MTKTCSRCGGEKISPGLVARLSSWPLIGAGIVLAVPTVGLSLVATIYGVFLRQPTCECDERAPGR